MDHYLRDRLEHHVMTADLLPGTRQKFLTDGKCFVSHFLLFVTWTTAEIQTGTRRLDAVCLVTATGIADVLLCVSKCNQCDGSEQSLHHHAMFSPLSRRPFYKDCRNHTQSKGDLLPLSSLTLYSCFTGLAHHRQLRCLCRN